MSFITFGILTVSDTCHKDPSKDASGPEAEKCILDTETQTGAVLKGQVLCKKIVPDEEPAIMKTLIQWSDGLNVNVILTTGGTGFAHRDVTPEATKRVIEKEAPGISFAMMNYGLKKTPMAILSRATCGIRGKTLIINLPGSPKAVQESLIAIADVIPHAVALILDNKPMVQTDHKKIQESEKCQDASVKHRNLAIVMNDVANRLRQSPYPMISLEQAKIIVASEALCEDIERRTTVVSLRDSRGRVLASNVRSSCDLPPFRASIKDGYAVIAKDGAGERLVLGGVEAGHEPDFFQLKNGECVRVNTGAPVPKGATAVVQVEDTKVIASEKTANNRTKETKIEILCAPQFDQDIRNVGSDIKKGELVLSEGTRIGAAEMGILAACGISEVPVMKLPVVGVMSTGNELQEPGEPLKPGHVYDSNKITLMETLKENGYDSVDLGIVKDDLQAMITAIENAVKLVDVLITTGSVSMGDKDMLKPILKEIFEATIHFGRVNLKPGKPTTFATSVYQGKKKYFLCLPGNPVSAMVTAQLFAIPLLHSLSECPLSRTIIKVELTNDFKLDPRPEYVRATVKWNDKNTIPKAYMTGNQISSRLLSFRSANALLMLPGKQPDKPTIKKGEVVEAMLLGFDNMMEDIFE
ncbi:gephyrin [Venturia canescens]|uniref:gephyrin n=1 Tax=Venturia canescens TaxID=32260 RepID=UPI001C9CE078|nr:gephyrin [Venturia canescens]